MKGFFQAVLMAGEDAIIDCLKILPILFLVYILIEYLTHRKKEQFYNLFKKNNKAGPLLGAVLGCVPQCGFSAVMADMFNHKLIGIGTLIAVFVATSDEALPILLGYPDKILTVLLLIGFKLLFAILFGYLFYGLFSLYSKMKHKKQNLALEGAEKDDKEYLEHHECVIDEQHIHEHEHKHKKNEPCDCCSENIFLSALKHSLTIILYILIANFAINLIFAFVGEDVLINALKTSAILQIFLAPLIGLIPNCVSSVVLIELFLSGGLIFPALIGGLSAGSGVGLIILFKNHKNIKENIFILLSLYFIGVLIGLILSIFIKV